MDEVDGYFWKDIVVHFINLEKKQTDKSIDFPFLRIRHRSRRKFNVLALFHFPNSMHLSFFSFCISWMPRGLNLQDSFPSNNIDVFLLCKCTSCMLYSRKFYNCNFSPDYVLKVTVRNLIVFAVQLCLSCFLVRRQWALVKIHPLSVCVMIC